MAKEAKKRRLGTPENAYNERNADDRLQKRGASSSSGKRSYEDYEWVGEGVKARKFKKKSDSAPASSKKPKARSSSSTKRVSSRSATKGSTEYKAPSTRNTPSHGREPGSSYGVSDNKPQKKKTKNTPSHGREPGSYYKPSKNDGKERNSPKSGREPDRNVRVQFASPKQPSSGGGASGKASKTSSSITPPSRRGPKNPIRNAPPKPGKPPSGGAKAAPAGVYDKMSAAQQKAYQEGKVVSFQGQSWKRTG